MKKWEKSLAERAETTMQQSDAGEPWCDVSRWVEFMIGVGFKWPIPKQNSRRIGLVSMPCDSPAAALVALGAMRRRLSIATASDVASHYERLRELANSPGPPVLLRWAPKKASKFLIDKIDENGMLWAKEVNSSTALRKIIIQSSALQWRFDGEPQVQVLDKAFKEGLSFGTIYDDLVPSSDSVLTSNLTQSDSGICFAGRPTGQAATIRMASSIKFRSRHTIADASQLLSVFGWSDSKVSRVTFFNSRTEKADRISVPPKIVVADGDASFLKAVDHNLFRNIDILGVFHRTLERERLETLGQKISDLAQWYEPDTAFLTALTPPPGISIHVMRRR